MKYNRIKEFAGDLICIAVILSIVIICLNLLAGCRSFVGWLDECQEPHEHLPNMECSPNQPLAVARVADALRLQPTTAKKELLP